MNSTKATDSEIAVERVVGFAEQFDGTHLDLACHAAFPQTLTPDLLYQIWLRFVPQAPWTAVARILLSRLCREVGYELYEMDVNVRNLLLQELKEDKRFDKPRLKELADFYTNYVKQQLDGDDLRRRDLGTAEYWMSLACSQPNQLNHKLALAIEERLKQKNWKELFRFGLFIESFPTALAEFEPPLITYARGMVSFTSGDLEGATEQFSQLSRRERQVKIAGVSLSIPDEIPLIFMVFNCEKSHPKGDIIFVHGLAGHPWGTWHPESKTDNKNVEFWPFWLGETLLDKKIDVNIWSFGYEAPGFKYFGQGISRFDQASNLLESLKVKNIGDRPFIFVTHSLGGLIVKEAIRRAQNFPQYQDILQHIKGIVFLSTPHTGTHLANLIENIGFLTKPTVNIEELREHSPQLRDLNEWYRQNTERLGILTKVFYETKPLNGILVVNEDSSNPGIKYVKPVAISEDHISIAKPGKNYLVYLSTIKFCEDVFIGDEYPPGLGNIPENFSHRTGAKKFVARDDVIHILNKQLNATEQVAITFVTGMGGIGKTELALQYAHFHLIQKTYTGGICWLNCRGQNVGPQIISFAISKFNLSFSKDDDLQTQIDSCWHNWQEGKVLVIFDDVVNYKDISDFLPPGTSRFKVLITTRQKWLMQSSQRLELEVLDKDAALELLISYVGSDRIQGELEEAEALCKDLGFLPLGLELVARYLERKPSLSLAKTRERLGLEHQSLEAFSRDMTAERGVAATFELSWTELEKDSKELGCLLSLFASTPIPWYLVEGCLPWVDEEELEDRRDEKLVNLSLLESVGGSSYWLHPLTRKFFRNKFSESDSIEIMKRSICQAIAKVARKIPDNITEEQVKEVEIDIPHIAEVAENLTEYLSDDDLIVPFTRLGCFYKDLGLYPQGQPWLEKGKEIAERRLDKDNPDVATVYNNLAELYRAQGKYEEAEPLLLQALEINKIALPKNHPSIAISLDNLALLYESQGKYEEAEPLLLQALEINKIALPENHTQIATHLNNLAGLYRAQGKDMDQPSQKDC